MPSHRKKSSPKKKNAHVASAAKTWDNVDINLVRDVAWCSFKFVSDSIAREFAGTESGESFVQSQVLEPSKATRRERHKGLALVCGDMQAERPFFESATHLKFSEVDGFDISKESLKKYHPKKGLKFNKRLVDCNYLMLPQDTFTLAVACHGAHHVYNLGNFFYQTNKALKDGGAMYIYEWIGPDRLQIPKRNHLIAMFLLLTLFSKAERTTHVKNIKGRWLQYSPETWEPSEACNSIELWPQFLKYFDPISVVFHGGLLYPIFEGIAQNLDENKAWDLWRIKLVYFLEKVLTKLKIVEPLFVVAVARKKPGVF